MSKEKYLKRMQRRSALQAASAVSETQTTHFVDSGVRARGTASGQGASFRIVRDQTNMPVGVGCLSQIEPQDTRQEIKPAAALSVLSTISLMSVINSRRK